MSDSDLEAFYRRIYLPLVRRATWKHRLLQRGRAGHRPRRLCPRSDQTQRQRKSEGLVDPGRRPSVDQLPTKGDPAIRSGGEVGARRRRRKSSPERRPTIPQTSDLVPAIRAWLERYGKARNPERAFCGRALLRRAAAFLERLRTLGSASPLLASWRAILKHPTFSMPSLSCWIAVGRRGSRENLADIGRAYELVSAIGWDDEFGEKQSMLARLGIPCMEPLPASWGLPGNSNVAASLCATTLWRRSTFATSWRSPSATALRS